MISRDQLLHLIHATADQADTWAEAINLAWARWRIDTPTRQAAWLAQVAHESAGFERLVENLNYTRADRILSTWPSRFADANDAAACVRQPEALANRVYAGRLGNGDRRSGDGWRYRGRGLIQITGRDNYARCSIGLYGYPTRLLNEPDLLAQPGQAAYSAGWYWHAHNLNALADVGDHHAITRAINGGLIGYKDRLAWLDRARAALGG